MHSRDRREFGRRKMRIKNKWEVVLVLTVIAAGIVITTVAAIKAKERRQLAVENKPMATNTTKAFIPHVRDVANNHSGDQSLKDSNRKRILAFNTSVKKPKTDESQPDYDVEYDLVKSGADEYTAMASESVDQVPKNRLRVPHDGLPGFPPPFGISNDFNPNVELSADAAGFVLEVPESSDDGQGGEEREVIPKSSVNFNSLSNSRLNSNINQIKSSIKIINNNNNNNLAKTDPKRIPVFADPPKEISEGVIKPNQVKPIEFKNDMKISVPNKMVSRIPIRNDQMANISPENVGPLRITLPALEPAIRFLGISDDFHHSVDYGVAPGVHPSIVSIPVHMRRYNSPDIVRQDNLHSINSNQNHKIRSKRESERRFTLRQMNTKSSLKPSSSLSEDYKENEPKTGESRYIPFNERAFMSDSREDSDRDHEEDDSERDSEDMNRPLFNFEDLENRFPSVLSSPRDHSHNKESYSTDESRNKHNYGILGSGNFEIIRGGIYADDESATNNVPNYVHESDERPNYENRKSEHSLPQHYSPNSDPNSDDDNEPNNQFGPFNLDFFTGSPVMGFQGWDSATNVDKAPAPARSAVNPSGQRRHFFDSRSADSNLHIIATDKDLYSDS